MADYLVIVELVGGEIDDSAWELAQAARDAGGDKVNAVLLGKDVAGHAETLTKAFDEVHVFDDEQLAVPDGQVSAALLVPFIERTSPKLVLVPQTNNGMDLAPALAIKLGRSLLTDLIAIDSVEDGILGVRTMYGGKVHARVKAKPTIRVTCSRCDPALSRPLMRPTWAAQCKTKKCRRARHRPPVR